jgi:hypothetical protein
MDLSSGLRLEHLVMIVFFEKKKLSDIKMAILGMHPILL